MTTYVWADNIEDRGLSQRIENRTSDVSYKFTNHEAIICPLWRWQIYFNCIDNAQNPLMYSRRQDLFTAVKCKQIEKSALLVTWLCYNR